jgi:DNA-directed RNA polymerase beta subunit
MSDFGFTKKIDPSHFFTRKKIDPCHFFVATEKFQSHQRLDFDLGRNAHKKIDPCHFFVATEKFQSHKKIDSPSPKMDEQNMATSELWHQTLELYFGQNDGKQIISHQLESFNHFMDVDISEIITMVNPVIVRGSPEIPLSGPRSALASATGLSTSAANALMGHADESGSNAAQAGPINREYEVHLEFSNPQFKKPTIFENNGAVLPMMPNDARLRNLTYSAPLYVDINVTYVEIDNTQAGKQNIKKRLFPNVHLGKIPVMVGSKYCLLQDQQNMDPLRIGECAEDLGGYFIIQGGERVCISQERMSENRPFVFRNNRQATKECEVIEVKSIGPDNDQVPKTNAVRVMYHPKNPQILLLRATLPRMKAPIPLFIIFRALGVTADKEIMDLILGPEGDSTFDMIFNESIAEAAHIHTKEEAIDTLTSYIKTWSSRGGMKPHEMVKDVLAEELFPHIGSVDKEFDKACFLAHMTRKVLWVMTGRIPNDDRDSYPNKRVDLPGFLLANLFRTHFSTMLVKDIKTFLAKEIHSGSWKATGNFEEILNISNIHKVIKSTNLEVGLKTCLATGNFGSAKAGGPSKNGVSQVVNRLNYMAYISHMRRVSTPIEKAGKLIAPRKLHNSQFGYICPAETPEGHSVGVVKNMASTSSVSIFSNPRVVRDFLERFGTLQTLEKTSVKEKHSWTRVFLNGAWIGLLNIQDTNPTIGALRNAKRECQIHPQTGIIWKSVLRELWITTEAGRMLRPLFYAPALYEVLTNEKVKGDVMKLASWEDLMLFKTPAGRHLIEYIDPGETEGTLIAMNHSEVVEDTKKTHAEIHPSCVLGSLASNIPFPDHNQSPRNAYQCLSVDEKVLMADGSQKRIADVQIGDEVIVIDPETQTTSISKVCHQYVRETEKAMFNIQVSGGRVIKATHDHPFITDHGRIRVENIDYTKHQMAIHMAPSPVSNVWNEQFQILDEETVRQTLKTEGIHESMIESHIQIMKDLQMLPLMSNDDRLPILARMCGFANSDGTLNVYLKTKTVNEKTYTYSLPQFQAHFGSKVSAEEFEGDIDMLKVGRVGIRESNRVVDGRKRHTWFVQHNGVFPSLLLALGMTAGKKTETQRKPIPDWIMKGSPLVKREFLAGFQGGDGCKFKVTVHAKSVSFDIPQTSQQASPDCQKALVSFMEQICILFKDLEIDCYMRSEEEMSEERTCIRFKIRSHKENILKFYDFVGYRYDNYKLTASAICAEFIREYRNQDGYMKKENWMSWLNKVRTLGKTIFLPIQFITPCQTTMVSDITVYNDAHTFVTSNMIVSGNCAMGKQAMGMYALNYRTRFDALAHLLCYPQIPLVSPFMSKFYGSESMPCGQNIMVAIMTYTGYNQEDSIMINRSFLQRGGFRSIFYRTYKDEEKKNQNSGEEERFHKPDPTMTRQMKTANYEKLGGDGFVPENAFVDNDDILIGKVVPLRVPTGTVMPAGTKKYRDVSRPMRNNEVGYVDKIFRNRNGEGYSFAKVRVRQDRIPEIGDKFSSRHGQKGTCGMILNAEDMPQTANGMIPDIIINPHCIPSRMTIAQLMETLLGKVGCELGALGDGTPFNKTTVEDLARLLCDELGMEPYGNEILYNGYTGKQMNTKIFMGPCFYQRLRHCSADKMHSRASGPLVMLTRQPAEGRAREGGLRFGEMERDSVIAHGMSEFTKERLMECSDAFRCYSCEDCGLLAVVNPEEGVWKCRGCGNRTNFCHVEIPYAYKLLLQELESMCISSRVIPKSKLISIKETKAI